MKSTLIFIDSRKNSKIGTLRGLVIFPIYIILTIIWFTLTKSLYKNKHNKTIIPLLFSALLIVSALGVHNPDSIKKAVYYGALVGFVIYGFASCLLLYYSNTWNYKISIITILWGIVSTGFLAYILYIITFKFPSIFSF